jgi:catechol 2,3-dioxygenase-like lactoylglutathione lyase family enzyme
VDLTPHHVGIVVSDLGRSKAFYRALGFAQDVEHVQPDKTISFMRLGALQIELFAYAEPAETPAEQTGRTLGFKHLALETADIDAALAELKAGGVVPADAQVLELPAGWRLLFFNDPDGLEIEIKQA